MPKKTYNGYTIHKGAYVGTSDDRYDRWYIENPNANYTDRRGEGFSTKKEAIEVAIRLPNANAITPEHN